MVKRFQICYNNRVLLKLNNTQYQPERGSRKASFFILKITSRDAAQYPKGSRRCTLKNSKQGKRGAKKN